MPDDVTEAVAAEVPANLKPDSRRIQNQDLLDFNLKCTVCNSDIPEEMQRRGAATCSDACRTTRTRKLRSFREQKQCKYCHKPSTYTQRRMFKRFMQWQEDQPTQAFPQTWAVLEPAGIDEATFRAAVAEAVFQDFSFEFTAMALEWHRFPQPEIPHEHLDRCIEALREYWARKGQKNGKGQS